MIVPLLIFHLVFLSKRSCMLVTFQNCLELVIVSGNITNLGKWPQCKSSRIFDQLGDGVHHKQLPCVWVAVQKHVCHILVSNTEEQGKNQSHSSILHFKLTSHSQLHWKEKCFSFFYPLYSFKHYHRKLTTRNIFSGWPWNITAYLTSKLWVCYKDISAHPRYYFTINTTCESSPSHCYYLHTCIYLYVEKLITSGFCASYKLLKWTSFQQTSFPTAVTSKLDNHAAIWLNRETAQTSFCPSCILILSCLRSKLKLLVFSLNHTLAGFYTFLFSKLLLMLSWIYHHQWHVNGYYTHLCHTPIAPITCSACILLHSFLVQDQESFTVPC